MPLFIFTLSQSFQVALLLILQSYSLLICLCIFPNLLSILVELIAVELCYYILNHHPHLLKCKYALKKIR